MPVKYFSLRTPWSVMFNKHKYHELDKDSLRVAIYRLDGDYRKIGPPLELDHLGLQNPKWGNRYTVIFRPKTLVLGPGLRYWVEITGLKSEWKDTAVKYAVEFTKLG